jgi:hypothetical protein
MKKAEGYYYATQKDIFEWETKMKFKNHLTYYKQTKKSKPTQSVQCGANAIDPFPVAHYRQCQNKTRNPNGLCHIHQLIHKNVTIKYWKN